MSVLAPVYGALNHNQQMSEYLNVCTRSRVLWELQYCAIKCELFDTAFTGLHRVALVTPSLSLAKLLGPCWSVSFRKLEKRFTYLPPRHSMLSDRLIRNYF